jgi:hypothetical protein
MTPRMMRKPTRKRRATARLDLPGSDKRKPFLPD